MKRALPLTIVAALASCKGEGPKKADDRSGGGETEPSSTTTGEINVDTTDETKTTVDTSTKTGTGVDTSGASMIVTGQVAIQTALLDAAPAGKVAAFEFSGSVFDTGAPKIFAVAADGKFSADLKKKGNDHFYDQFFKADGSIDVALAKQKLPPQDTQGLDDNEVAQRIREGKAYYDNVGYVLVGMAPKSPASDTWQDRMVARATETESFRFIGLKAGDAALIGLPVQKALVPQLDVGALNVQGDDAVSQVEASDKQFDVPTEVLNEFAKTNDAFKRIKNAYINTDPVDKKQFNLSQVFSWTLDEIKTATLADGFTDPAFMKTSYNGYTARFETNRSEFTIANICVAGAVRLYPPTDPDVPFVEMKKNSTYSGGAGFCPTSTTPDADAKSRFFCETNPISNADMVLAGDGKSCPSDWQVATTLNFNFDVEQRGNNGQTDNWARINWGTDDGFKGAIPKGLWRLEVDGLGPVKTVAQFDLAKGFPFDEDGDPTMYVPRLKLTRDANKKITDIEVRLYRWDDATTGYVPARLETASRVISRTPTISLYDFSPPSGQQNSETFKLYPIEGSEEARYGLKGKPLTYDWRAGMDANPGDVTAYWDLDNAAINIEAYGTSYRFVMRDYSQY